nr:hypothetical protein [Tanacetum cinerariifolium]
MIRDSEETLMLEAESRSKMLQKQEDPMMSEKKVNTKPVDYAALNQLSQDFETRFVTQTELSAEQAFWSQNSRNSEEPNLFISTTIVEVPKELPKVSMAVEQHCVEKKKFQDKMKDVLKENERLLEQAISTDIVNIVVNANVNYAVNLLASASGSQPQGNTKKDRIHQTQSRTKKNKLYDHPSTVRPSLHNKNSVVNTKSISSIPNSMLNVNSDLKCATCNGCLFSNNHDSCVLEFINSVVQIVLWYLDSGCYKHMTGDRSHLINFVQKFLAQSQEKDTVIMKLKERIKSLSGNVKEEKIKRELKEIETINIELDHRVTKLVT